MSNDHPPFIVTFYKTVCLSEEWQNRKKRLASSWNRNKDKLLHKLTRRWTFTDYRHYRFRSLLETESFPWCPRCWRSWGSWRRWRPTPRRSRSRTRRWCAATRPKQSSRKKRNERELLPVVSGDVTFIDVCQWGYQTTKFLGFIQKSSYHN